MTVLSEHHLIPIVPVGLTKTPDLHGEDLGDKLEHIQRNRHGANDSRRTRIDDFFRHQIYRRATDVVPECG